MTIGLIPVVWIVLYIVLWLRANVPESVYPKIELVFLLATEIIGAAAAVLSITGTLVLGYLFYRRKSEADRRLCVARGFLLCLSILIGLAAAEAVTMLWLSRSGPITAPAGPRLDQTSSKDAALRFAEPQRQIPLPVQFPDPPGDREIDLVVLGGSSAEGVPLQRWVSIGRLIAWKLQDALPDRPIRLQIVARAGDTLEKQHQLFIGTERRPDVVLIYSGHNEFFSRLWWSRNLDYYEGTDPPGRLQVLFDRLERASSLGTLIRETANTCRLAIPPSISNDRDLVDVPIYTKAEASRILEDFRRRLDELVSYAEHIRALPILILPPANDSGFEPNRSFLPPATTPSERAAFRDDFLTARRLESVEPGAAIGRYRTLLARQPRFAETHFRLAVLLERSGEWDEAYKHYALARDLDGHPVRCLTSFQNAYHEVASRHGCALIDGQSYFHAIGRHGFLDDELFQDAMHPSFRGQIALAQAVLNALRERGSLGLKRSSPPIIIDPVDCATHFGIDIDAWESICSWGQWFNDKMAPLRFDPSERHRKRELAVSGAAQIAAGIAPESLGLPNVGIPEPVPVSK